MRGLNSDRGDISKRAMLFHAFCVHETMEGDRLTKSEVICLVVCTNLFFSGVIIDEQKGSNASGDCLCAIS